jgi:VanZ family protein
VKRLAVEYWMPLVLWLLVIFSFSTDAFGSEKTSRIIVPFLRFFSPRLSFQELEFLHAVIRKFGHVTEYFILAVLAYRTLRQEQPGMVQAQWRTLLLVALAAASDEVHQGFTLSRTASPADIGYDCFGAVWGLWTISMYEARRLRTHSVL